MDVQLTKCCSCIPLKSGVVIASSLWLIYGIFQTVSNVLYLISPNEGINFYKYISACTFSTIIFYGLITLGALFGLFVVSLANTYKMMSIYSKIARGIVGLDIISHIVTVVVTVLYKSSMLDDCIGPGDITSSRADACNKTYTSLLTLSIAITAISIPLSVYFSIIISAYAYKRKKKENPESSDDELDDFSYDSPNAFVTSNSNL
ncbi:hypothetical protein RhiirA5_497012 [Rhizophagus irregularis]|uniref:Uncharacterized protein n=3 Tax=Rhizophagus irregularis TaxID=588596 RepID=A0A2I1E8C7_9GLOM|nr:hypothetical protein GLOIN_2v1522839 [Rhizophagus irregularis DAOM 181602=DAOM 197198]PKC12348.1 hypothetical protein RhiirA5_497012 [Rhizophagus irregularis]PKY18369.1 hypothetical protein RhiirB3_522714 [Rhizophagus irregularis]POG79990.1 hypothetical protein GLOIN_2v1522839 [Rhizophagus irregularis DAOM 181602=DAOM 197198]UZO22532.1 hypothetical protein OCT59_014894 [Rhizophagus irregularis]CAB4491603.1 unnamed protein product [Rhizophagus irregularis]|eukprot:XP_025186856.1 hypothetical protein GLOIN_2v1522839 [Rhizophagus irregularis DAOM 181602=DAOM 197198]